MRLKLKWKTWSLLAAIVLLSVLAVVLGRSQGLSSSEWAAWVQAVGGIAAVAAAIWISLESSRQAERAKREENRALYRGIRQIAQQAKELVVQIDSGDVWNTLKPQTEPQYLWSTYVALMQRSAKEIHAVLAAFPMDRLATINLVDTVIDVRRAMCEIETQLRWWSFDHETGRLIGAGIHQFAPFRTMVEDAWRKMPAAPPR